MITVKARIRLFAGVKKRQTPFASGYRPMFRFIPEMSTSGKITLIDGGEFHPGEEKTVLITFSDDKYLGDNFNSGSTFTFHEGIDALGEGEIISIH